MLIGFSSHGNSVNIYIYIFEYYYPTTNSVKAKGIYIFTQSHEEYIKEKFTYFLKIIQHDAINIYSCYILLSNLFFCPPIYSFSIFNKYFHQTKFF